MDDTKFMKNKKLGYYNIRIKEDFKKYNKETLNRKINRKK